LLKTAEAYNVLNAVKFAMAGDRDPESPIFIRFLDTRGINKC